MQIFFCPHKNKNMCEKRNKTIDHLNIFGNKQTKKKKLAYLLIAREHLALLNVW